MRYSHKQIHSRARLRGLAAAAAGLLALPLAASGAHWPAFGGDPGRSGHQPVDQAAVDATTRPAFPPVDDAGQPRTSVVFAEATAALAYGMYLDAPGNDDQTHIHIRDPATGAERVAAADQVLDAADGNDDDNVLGTASRSVSPVVASRPGASDRLLVVHNDDDSAAAPRSCLLEETTASDNDIALAEYDMATGERLSDLAVGRAQGGAVGCDTAEQVADGHTIESSPVITPELDGAGRRALVFVARRDGTSQGRIFRVDIPGGTGGTPVDPSEPQHVDVTGLNTAASPTIAYLDGPAGPEAHVVVPVGSANGAVPTIRTYRVRDLQPGPTAPTGVAGTPQTVSVPVAGDGSIPGEAGSGAATAPALFAAYDNGDGTTTVRKFVPSSGGLQVAAGSKAIALAGSPSPALAVTEVVDPESGETLPGSVIVTTGLNLVVLDADTLEVVDRYRDTNAADAPEAPLTPGGSGFSRTSPSASGGFVFVSSDDGRPLVLRESDGEPVPPSAFTADPATTGATFATGAPAYSRGNLAFLSDAGLFAYRTGVVPVPPTPAYTVTPNPADLDETVTFDAGGSTDSDGSIARHEWDLDGDGSFETDTGASPVATRAYAAAGLYTTQLRVTDDRGNTATLAKDLVVASGRGNRPPTASFKVSPDPPAAGRRVTYDAGPSADPDGRIVRHEWDLDGNGSFERNTGADPTTTRTYATPRTRNVKLRVTDDDGAGTEIARQVTVIRTDRLLARRLTASVTPSSDLVLPFRFTTSGTLRLPRGVTRRDGCKGRITVTVKRGTRTVSRRTTRLSRRCRYSSTVTFADRSRVGRNTSLSFKARFQGNAVVLPRQAAGRRARVG